jgi:hypothetical protein
LLCDRDLAGTGACHGKSSATRRSCCSRALIAKDVGAIPGFTMWKLAECVAVGKSFQFGALRHVPVKS